MTDAVAVTDRPTVFARFGSDRFDLDATLARPLVWYGAIACLALLQSALIVSHRPWLDEWQAIQLAVQSPDLGALLASLRYEGHPPLWYLILRGLATIVPVFWVLRAASALIALVLQSTILGLAPFSRAERLGIAAGEWMLFEYLTLSRSLSLGVCCLVLALALWRRRWMWLPIALLPMCDFLFGVLSVILIILAVKDRRLWVPGLAAWGVVGLAAAWSIRPAPDMIQALERTGVAADGLDWITRLGVLLVPLQAGTNGLGWNNVPPLGAGIVLGPLFLLFGWRQTAGDRLHRLLFLGFALLTLGFGVFVYPLQTRHLSLIGLLLLLLKWREADRGDHPDQAFRLWLIVGSVCGLVVATVNLVLPFDTADRAAAVIRRNGLEHRLWLTFPDSRSQGVAALTGMEFTRLERECTQSFIRWDYRTAIETPEALERYLRDFGRRWGRAYLLSPFPLTGLEGGLHGELRLIAHVPAGFDGQDFSLFEVSPELPLGRRMPPRWPGPRRPFAPSVSDTGPRGSPDVRQTGLAVP